MVLAYIGLGMKDGLRKTGQKLKITFALNAWQAFKLCPKFVGKALSALAALSVQATTSST